jgi:hypothetical protein
MPGFLPRAFVVLLPGYTPAIGLPYPLQAGPAHRREKACGVDVAGKLRYREALLMKIGLISVVALVLATGCAQKETTSSSNIRTKGIAATISVTAGGSSSEVEAILRVGGDESNTYVILENGDKMVADVAGDKKDMQAQSEGVYQASYGTNAAETEFKVMLEREEDDDALGNVVKLPPPFTIGALPTNSPSRANEDVTVTWDASTSGDDMTMRVKGSCIFDEDFDIPGDSGSFVIAKGKLESTGGSNPETCDLEVTMWRTRKGTVDSALDNESTIKATQKRTAKFTSAP